MPCVFLHGNTCGGATRLQAKTKQLLQKQSRAYPCASARDACPCSSCQSLKSWCIKQDPVCLIKRSGIHIEIMASSLTNAPKASPKPHHTTQTHKHTQYSLHTTQTHVTGIVTYCVRHIKLADTDTDGVARTHKLLRHDAAEIQSFT